MSYNIGDKLYFVYSDRRRGEPQEVTITAIGRKWLSIDKSWIPRINKETLFADGGQYTSPGQCYLSKDDYERSALRAQRWDTLRAKISRTWDAPDHLDTPAINEIIRMIAGKEPSA